VIVTDADIVGPWVADRNGHDYLSGSCTALGWARHGVLVAGVLFNEYNGRSVQMHVASDGSRHWMTREFLRACFWYPFEQLGVRKIIGLVDSTNHDAQRFDEHLGFVRECVIKDAGKVEDLIVYSMTRQQCRFLKG